MINSNILSDDLEKLNEIKPLKNQSAYKNYLKFLQREKIEFVKKEINEKKKILKNLILENKIFNLKEKILKTTEKFLNLKQLNKIQNETIYKMSKEKDEINLLTFLKKTSNGFLIIY